MQISSITGVIERRILANYRVDPDQMADVLPEPFRPQLVNGHAIGGICLIRLARVRPKFFPLPWGIESENAAHRIAVEWEADGQLQRGVYVPRRDTSSWLSTWIGGRIFPGVNHHARFDVQEAGSAYSVGMSSDDGQVSMRVSGTVADNLPETSVFETVDAAAAFFAAGAVGYSDASEVGRFEGLEMNCHRWDVEPLHVNEIQSSFFDDLERFPSGTVEFDCALLMRDIPLESHGRPGMTCPTACRV
ncbi:MAG: DUF2071 domain-containing protein [Planctomycetaceae bacterium]